MAAFIVILENCFVSEKRNREHYDRCGWWSRILYIYKYRGNHFENESEWQDDHEKRICKQLRPEVSPKYILVFPMSCVLRMDD